jgi:DNA polymerase
MQAQGAVGILQDVLRGKTGVNLAGGFADVQKLVNTLCVATKLKHHTRQAAGQLLNKILEAINFKREDVYIANILKSRPPGNRKPNPDEVEACLPYLKKQIELIKPKVILCLGLTAAENLLGTTEGLGRLRGRVLSYEGVPVMVTYHPAALLRNPAWKRPAWEDVQAARKLHDKEVAKG